MPFKRKSDGSIEFVRLPLDKFVYGVEKGDEDRKYLYLRRFDLSGLNTSSIESLVSTAAISLFGSSSENDWIIPIKSSLKLNYNLLKPYSHLQGVSNLLSLPVNDRPWFTIIKTPNNIAYFAKRRLSASTTLQAIGLAASFANPATAVGAIGWFARKQHFKYKMAKSRGEQDPSIIPKIFVHKTWQVSLTGESEEIYKNIALLLNSGTAWNDFLSTT